MENIPTITLEDYDHFRSKYIHKQTLKRNQDSYHIRQVDLCRHIDNSDDAIILKTIITPTSAPPGCFLFESQFCLKLKEDPHPNLVKIIDIAQLPVPETDERKILITMEYCQNGSLFDELLNQKPIDIRKAFQDIYSALDSIWSRGFLHGDLNICNILSDGSHYKLCTVQISHAQKIKPLDAFDTVGGVLGYLSLEAVCPNLYNAKVDFILTLIFQRLSWTWRINFKNTRASELFSLGIILLQVFLDGVNPFHDVRVILTFHKFSHSPGVSL
ncbi:kinase-like domain-containing protein [Paraphysoderma sedebokerense]|nr:kinase-like domain-containing protein [Paraphysoderma sedebokerense]